MTDALQHTLDTLTAHGLEPHADDDGDVLFEHEGLTWMVTIDAEDRDCLQLAVPNLWRIESEAEAVRVQWACLEVGRRVKAAKAFPMGANTWVTLELLAVDGNWGPLVERALGIGRLAVNTFVAAMRSDSGPPL